jgi:hypothetical protein
LNWITAAPVPVPSGRTAAWYAEVSRAAAAHVGAVTAEVADAGEAGAALAVDAPPPDADGVAVAGAVGEADAGEDAAVVGVVVGALVAVPAPSD